MNVVLVEFGYGWKLDDIWVPKRDRKIDHIIYVDI